MTRAVTLLLLALPLASCDFWAVDEWTWTDESQPPEQRLGWQNPAGDLGVNAEGAQSTCEGLTWDGYEDWRVPTFRELTQLWSAEIYSSPAGECHWKRGLYGQCGCYTASDGRLVDFHSDTPPALGLTNCEGNKMVRCVRGVYLVTDALSDPELRRDAPGDSLHGN